MQCICCKRKYDLHKAFLGKRIPAELLVGLGMLRHGGYGAGRLGWSDSSA